MSLFGFLRAKASAPPPPPGPPPESPVKEWASWAASRQPLLREIVTPGDGNVHPLVPDRDDACPVLTPTNLGPKAVSIGFGGACPVTLASGATLPPMNWLRPSSLSFQDPPRSDEKRGLPELDDPAPGPETARIHVSGRPKPTPFKRFPRHRVDSLWQVDLYKFRIAGVRAQIYVHTILDYLHKRAREASNNLWWAFKNGRSRRPCLSTTVTLSALSWTNESISLPKS